MKIRSFEVKSDDASANRLSLHSLIIVINELLFEVSQDVCSDIRCTANIIGTNPGILTKEILYPSQECRCYLHVYLMDGFISLESGTSRLHEEFDVFTLLSDDLSDSNAPSNFSPSKCGVTSSEQPSDNGPELSTAIKKEEKGKTVYPRCKRILTRPPFLISSPTPTTESLLNDGLKKCDKRKSKELGNNLSNGKCHAIKVKKIKELPLEQLMSIEDVPEQSKTVLNQTTSSPDDGSSEVIKRLQHKLNQSENEREHLQS